MSAMYQKGKIKTGGRKKGVPNRVTSQIREQLAITLIRYFGAKQILTSTSPDGSMTMHQEDTFNMEYDMVWHNMTRFRLMLQMAKLVVPPPKEEEEDTTIHLDTDDEDKTPMQCGFIVPRNEPKVSISELTLDVGKYFDDKAYKSDI